VEVVKNKNYSDLVQLTDDIMIRLSPPSIDNVIGAETKNQIDLVMEIVRECLVEIIEGEDIFSAQDHTKEELDDFLNSLNSGQFQKIQGYYDSLPKMKQDIEYTCKKCGKTEKQTLEGLASFFASA
jgi:rubrerythrin